MNRQEWKDWAMSLKPGDKVIVQQWYCPELAIVKKVTPKGWIVTEKHGTYSQTESCEYFKERGGNYYMLPWTEEKGQEATVTSARKIAFKWASYETNVDFELAKKIIELDKQMEE